ncbi:hypothetical protein B9Z19DRAFT_1064491 [Tuber borchii]|uniref:Uncharacterized protein n=1 Tax=Tuber borchii TaxID=42251 RepID=A0A2T6ZUL1_TUBBO|nr:hypothetical protein B9Z19DRAFT_1064491 [Tuber borchii]
METDAPSAPEGNTETPVSRTGAGWLYQITETIGALHDRFGMIADSLLIISDTLSKLNEPSKEREPEKENQNTIHKATEAPCTMTPYLTTQDSQRRGTRLVESAQNGQLSGGARVGVEEESQDITTATTASTQTQTETQVLAPPAAHLMSLPTTPTPAPSKESQCRKARHISFLESKWGAGWEKTIDSQSDHPSLLSEHYLGNMVKLASGGMTLLDAKRILRHVIEMRVSRPRKGVRTREIVMAGDIQKVVSAIAAVSHSHNTQPEPYTTAQLIAFLGATGRTIQRTPSITRGAPPPSQVAPSQRATFPTRDMQETGGLAATSPVAGETVAGGQIASTRAKSPALRPRAGAGVTKKTGTSVQVVVNARARAVEDKNITTTTTTTTQTKTQTPALRPVHNTSLGHPKISTNSTPSSIMSMGPAATDKTTKVPHTNTPRRKPQGPGSQSMRTTESAQIVPASVTKKEKEQTSAIKVEVKKEVKKEEESIDPAIKVEPVVLKPRPGTGISKRRGSGSGGRSPTGRRWREGGPTNGKKTWDSRT